MNREHRLLLVDDDTDHLLILTHTLKKLGVQCGVQAAGNSEKAKELFSIFKPHVVTLDLSLDEKTGPTSGLGLLSEFLSIDPLCRVIVLTGHSSNEFGIQAIERGAHAFLSKPATPEQLKVLIEDSFKQYDLREELKNAKSKHIDEHIVGESEAIKRIKEELLFVSRTPQPVLLLGETGTGKGVVAKTIFSLSGGKEFVRYQPTITSPELVGSELFGHLKGAFTGALEERAGLLKRAHRGVLFIDEIAELPIPIQVSLLGVLQDKKFRSIGSDKECESDFKLISATNADLQKNCDQGSFRSDLLHRVNHHVLELPPLRNRKEDIKPLAESFLRKLSHSECITPRELSRDALLFLESQPFPGNVRELQALVERGAYRAEFEKCACIEMKHCITHPSKIEELSFQEKVELYKISLIEDALRQCDGNQVKASEALRLDRSTLRRILARKL